MPTASETQASIAVVPNESLDTAAVHRVYESSGLAERRPLDEPGRLQAMLDGSNLVVTATVDGLLVGISRSISDFSYSTYLSDIAVDRAYQGRGIGLAMIEETRRAAPAAKIVLLSAPAAVDFYPHVGFTQHQSAWTLPALGT